MGRGLPLVEKDEKYEPGLKSGGNTVSSVCRTRSTQKTKPNRKQENHKNVDGKGNILFSCRLLFSLCVSLYINIY